jgi:hypothetical protein
MPFTDGFPNAVTFEQMQEACAVLGLPLQNLVGLSMSVQGGVTAVLHVTDDAGAKVVHNGRVLTTELQIPLTREEVPDAPA